MAALEHKLLVVAHPDDECIFFGGLLQREAARGWRVVCVTDGNADGRGAERRREFAAACRKLGARAHEHWDFPDVFERRLDRVALTERLRRLGAFREVYTHSVIGDYGHPHHQDVAMAVTDAFASSAIRYVAYNCAPEKSVALTAAEFRRKLEVLVKVYGKETARFLNILPATAFEGFTRVPRAEVEAIYAYLSGGGPKPSPRRLRVYAKLLPYLEILVEHQYRRIF